MQLDVNVVFPDFFDWVVESDLSSLDFLADVSERSRNVHRGNRAIKNAVFADAAVKRNDDTVELVTLFPGGVLLAILPLGQHALVLFDHSLVPRRRLDRETLRQQIVSPIPGAHPHHLTTV